MEILALEKFNPNKAEITALAMECQGIEINGINDKSGYKAADEARIKLKKARVLIEKTGKEYRASAVAYQKAVIKYEDELVAIIEPTECELKSKQQAIDDEKEKLERIKVLPGRRLDLKQIELEMIDDELLSMDADQFAEFFAIKRGEYFQRKQQEADAKEREDKRLADLQAARDEAAANAVKETLEKVKQEEEENQRKADADAKKIKEDAEKLAEQKIYKEFLTKNSYNDASAHLFKIDRQGNTVTLYKFVDLLIIK